MPYYNQPRSRFQYSRRFTAKKSYGSNNSTPKYRRRRFTRPTRPMALSGMTRTPRSFGNPTGHHRLPLPYLIHKTIGPNDISVGTQSPTGPTFGERHVVTQISVDTGDMLSGVLLTVSLPVLIDGSVYSAEILLTTDTLKEGRTTTLPAAAHYHEGCSTRMPTRLPRPGSSFSRRTFKAVKATNRSLYFRLNATADVSQNGRPLSNKIYLIQHMYGFMEGEINMINYIRTNVRSNKL